MKKTIFILVLIAIAGCKNKSSLENNGAKSDSQNEGYITIQGEFIYDDERNIAIIQKDNDVYSVIIDENMHKLNENVSPLKKEKHHMVPVTIRAKKTKNTNPSILWEHSIEIKDILTVGDPNNTTPKEHLIN